MRDKADMAFLRTCYRKPSRFGAVRQMVGGASSGRLRYRWPADGPPSARALGRGARNLLIRLAAVSSIFAAAVSATPAGAADPYDINVILPLSGNAAFLGKTEQEALQVVETVANKRGGVHGRPVHFTFRDDQSTPQLAVQLASQAVPARPPAALASAPGRGWHPPPPRTSH